MQRTYVHGLGQTPTSWEKTIAQLKLTECSVCPDLAEMLRGKEATYRNLYEAFEKTCNAFEQKISICGISLGGILALNYAVDHPQKINSLVLIGSQYKMPKGLLKVQNVLFRFMPRFMFEQTGVGKKEFIMLCKTMMKLDFTNSIQEITCPTLVICGEKDSANKKAAVEMADILKNAQLRLINGAGHEVNVETPERLAEVLLDFYNQVG